MYQIRIEVPDDKLRAAIRANRGAILAFSGMKIMTMDPDELRDIVAKLIVTILAEEIHWLDERGFPCTIGLTEDEHVYVVDFAQLPDALHFQRVWGGELCDDSPAVLQN